MFVLQGSRQEGYSDPAMAAQDAMVSGIHFLLTVRTLVQVTGMILTLLPGSPLF